MTITYLALHQLGHGDIHLPEEAHADDDGRAVAEFKMGEVLSFLPVNPTDGSVYYDAVSCYDEFGFRVRIFSIGEKWVTQGEYIRISAYDN